MAQKRNRSPSPSALENIFRSSPIQDRSSKFIAFYSPTLSYKQLQAQSELQSATHRIAAWRRPSTQKSLADSPRLMDSGHDDDGEKYGGKALSSVMAAMDVEGAVVVARWYGGVMLGPVRFEHMKACARDAVSAWVRAEKEVARKRAKVRADEEVREQLVKVLPERDQSIIVLRGLLAEKTQLPSSGPGSGNAPAKAPNYDALPVATLQKLEQVRDATIGWILQQIEKAESSRVSIQSKEADLSRSASVAQAEESTPIGASKEALERNENLEEVGVTTLKHHEKIDASVDKRFQPD